MTQPSVEVAGDLMAEVSMVAQPWVESTYYADAEKMLGVFWSAESPFRKRFDRLDLTETLELACGHGRHSLLIAANQGCRSLVALDVLESNVIRTRERLSGLDHARAVLGDGHSLPADLAGRLSAVVCYDAMVNFSPRIVAAYLASIAVSLKPGGMALLHHSNHDTKGNAQHYGLNPHARNHMTFDLLQDHVRAAGLTIVESDTVNWGGVPELDRVTLLARPRWSLGIAARRLGGPRTLPAPAPPSPALPDADWREALMRAADGKPGAQVAVPRFPEAQLQVNTTGASGSATMAEAFQFYGDCLAAYERHSGHRLGPGNRVLDFGCGWGRISRPFLREVGHEGLHGIDVSPDLVSECRKAFGTERFSVCSAMPPTTLADGSFDLVVGYSVFSHLGEDACRAWLAEFARICRPGGVIALTTRSRSFFDFSQNLKQHAKPGTYHWGLAHMFDDFDAARARYDRGEFVHSNAAGVTGGGVLSADFYGETFISRDYAERGFADRVTLVDWLEHTEAGGKNDVRRHPVMIFTPKTDPT